MKPAESSQGQEQGDLYRSRLSWLLDHRHPLKVLAEAIDWEYFKREFGALYVEQKGRPGLPMRLLVGLHYLKHLYDVSDERVVAGFVENPYWQYFCGEEFFVHELPCDPTSLVKWRKRIGPGGMEKLLQETIAAAQRQQALKPAEIRRVNVDTTVEEEAIAFSTDARLEHKKYEFGCKVSVVTTSKRSWVVGIAALHGNPYDGHTLKAAHAQVAKLTGVKPEEIFVDKGYRGTQHHPENVAVYLSGRKLSGTLKRLLRRRSAIEPVIGHLKQDHRMARNFLHGADGDCINALLVGCGFNLRKLLRVFFWLIFGWADPTLEIELALPAAA